MKPLVGESSFDALEVWLEAAMGDAAAPIVSRLMFRPDGSLPGVRIGDRDFNLRSLYPLTALSFPA